MKKILLTIEDDVYSNLRTFLTAKAFTGSAYGILDELGMKLIMSIDDGKTDLHLEFKNKKGSKHGKTKKT